MRIVVTGATGNVGTSVLAALAPMNEVEEIVAIARRPMQPASAKVGFVSADITRRDLRPVFAGADAVVHLAWQLQPSRRPGELTRTNVEGSRRVFEAVVASGVPALVHASSVGAYAAHPGRGRVDESWPATGISTSLYSRQKAEVERLLDVVERESPKLRVVRFRPALVFKHEAAAEIHRLFVGPLVPRIAYDRRVLRRAAIPAELAFQCVHAHDVGRAFARAAVGDVQGAYNLAADPPLDADTLCELLGARKWDVEKDRLRRLVDISWRLHLQRTDPGWLDLAFDSPLMDTARARRELSWEPRHDATETLTALLEGLRHGDGGRTPPLLPRGPLRRAAESALRNRLTQGART